MTQSLIIVMSPSGEHQHYDLGIMNLVNQPMLVANLASPLTRTVAGELLGLARACAGMLHQFS